MLKIELRKKYKAAFRQWAGDIEHPTSSYALAQKQLDQQLSAYLKTKEGTAAAYVSMWGEPCLDNVVSESQHLNWVFPKVDGQNLSFWQSSLDFKKGPWGIMEPDPQNSQEVNKDEIKYFLVPAVGFDQFGNRLGRGKGFYDRALSRVKREKIGVAFDVQVSKKEMASEDHDVKMNFIATESGVVEVN